MSLRWRLTILSTVISALVFAAFGVAAFMTVRFTFYKAIDDNLERETAVSLLYIREHQNEDISNFNSDTQIGTVFYTVYSADGQVLSTDRGVTLDESLFGRALAGETPKGTVSLPDGSRVRVLMRPLRDSATGQITTVLQGATPLGFVDQILDQLLLIMAGVGLLLIAVVIVGSHLLTGRALRAVGQVTEQARSIELSQDLSQRIPETGADDELGRLVVTFNQMLEKLDAAFEAQRRFIADSSHELRTPLTVIKSNLHLLRQAAERRANWSIPPGDGTTGDWHEMLEITEAEVSRLSGMVNDLLYMAQMQAGHDRAPAMSPVELDSLLLEVFARARPMAAVKGQRVVLSHEDIATTVGDRDQLQHLLLNLLDNAIKYTPEGGMVRLGLWNDGAWARVEVTDSGPGIPESELSLVFDRFFRSQDARVRERNGSGLGLAIVKSITEAHGGRIEVLSKLGEGSTFRLWLKSAGQPGTPDAQEEPQPTAAIN